MESFGVLSFVVLGLLLWLAWTLFKPIWDGSRLRRGTTVFLVLALLVLGGLEARWLYGQHKGSEAVAAISGNKDGYLECQRFSKTFFDARGSSRAGEVEWRRPERAMIRYKECRDLINWVVSPGEKEFNKNVGFAMFVLTHEAVHVAGEQDEAITECTALQLSPETMNMFGVSEEEAREYLDDYYENIYPNQRKQYISEECRDGGELDLYPELVGFPVPYLDQSPPELKLNFP